jgi:hypothetical protein
MAAQAEFSRRGSFSPGGRHFVSAATAFAMTPAGAVAGAFKWGDAGLSGC